MGIEFVDSTSDDRTVNNTMRHEYRVLTDDEKAKMKAVKDMGRDLIDLIQTLPPNYPEMEHAIMKVEEAVMWAVKGLTK